MSFSACIIAMAAFLSVIVSAVFALLVIGIRKGDRDQHLSDAPGTVLDALTRRFLGVSVHCSHYEDK